jgi:adenosylcobinamide-phosphate synthase
MFFFFAVSFLALSIERFTGYPDALLRSIGHPVQWMGALISWLDAKLNPEDRPGGRLAGLVVLFVLLIVTGGVAAMVALILRRLPYGWIAEAMIATPFLAQKSLGDHVRAVADGLGQSLAEGRSAVSRIVGRDPEMLDRSGVARAALESLGENASDAIVAPAFWLALLGLPGIILYKAINTADSMIGHRSPRHLHFGWAAARFDDLVNLPGARLTGLLLAVSALFSSPARGKAACIAMMRDAHRHVSPNAGWPESALGGALGVTLGGPRSYDGRQVDLATMGDGKSQLDEKDIRDGLRLYGRALSLLTVLALLLALVS